MDPLLAWFQETTETKTEAPTTKPKMGERPGEGWSLLLMPIGIIVIFLFLFWLPQRRQERERQQLLSQSGKGDRVVTTAGIYGTIVGVSDTKDEVTVEIDNNVRVKMMKGAIMRNFTAEERVAQAGSTPANPETKKS